MFCKICEHIGVIEVGQLYSLAGDFFFCLLQAVRQCREIYFEIFFPAPRLYCCYEQLFVKLFFGGSADI